LTLSLEFSAGKELLFVVTSGLKAVIISIQCGLTQKLIAATENFDRVWQLNGFYKKRQSKLAALGG
jgi:hypothetical protein